MESVDSISQSALDRRCARARSRPPATTEWQVLSFACRFLKEKVGSGHDLCETARLNSAGSRDTAVAYQLLAATRFRVLSTKFLAARSSSRSCDSSESETPPGFASVFRRPENNCLECAIDRKLPGKPELKSASHASSAAGRNPSQDRFRSS